MTWPGLPRLPGEAGVNPGPVVTVGLGQQVLLGDDDVAVVRPDLFHHGHMAVRADAVRAAAPFGDRSGGRLVVDGHAMLPGRPRPLVSVAEQVARPGDAEVSALDVGDVVRALVAGRHPPV